MCLDCCLVPLWEHSFLTAVGSGFHYPITAFDFLQSLLGESNMSKSLERVQTERDDLQRNDLQCLH